jgi:hypothetical protein
LWQGVDNELDAELVELTSEISLKQKLIEELEMSQKRMEVMKSQYENKLQVRTLRVVSDVLKEDDVVNRNESVEDKLEL